MFDRMLLTGGTAAILAVSVVALAGCRSTAGASSGARKVIADEHGFSPASLPLPKGAAGATENVTFLRTTDNTCATEVVFPELSLKKPLPLEEPVVIAVPVDRARTLTFQCGMGMYKGALVVN
jgi:plastocyanin domain-containing protein